MLAIELVQPTLINQTGTEIQRHQQPQKLKNKLKAIARFTDGDAAYLLWGPFGRVVEVIGSCRGERRLQEETVANSSANRVG
jgi:hypothetical protein